MSGFGENGNSGKNKKNQGWNLMELLTNKQFSILLLGAIVLALMLIYWGKESTATSADAPAKTTQTTAESSKISGLENELEKKLRDNLQAIHGVGNVRVSVSLSSGIKNDYVQNDNVTKRNQKQTDKSGGVSEITEETTSSQLAMLNGASQPVVIMEQKPEIEGILVIAEGAGDPKTKDRIHTAVCTLLNIPAGKVSVEEMGGSETGSIQQQISIDP